MNHTLFLGYPQYPTQQAEVMRAFASNLQTELNVSARTWEDLNVGGRIIIDQILEAIDECDMAVFDISTPNPNVLFEAGYAIGRGKQVWFTLDTSFATAQKSWKELAILKEIGYVAYKNSINLTDMFKNTKPIEKLPSIYDQTIEPLLRENYEGRKSLFYCSTFDPFEASIKLNTLVDDRQRKGLEVITSDPRESSIDPLTWFAPRLANAAGALVHFAGENRNRSAIHNNRHAFMAGMALGLDTPILMIAEGDYPAPFDYESTLHKYDNAEECVETARSWLDGLSFDGIAWNSPRRSLKSTLGGIRFGEHVAENERTELSDYFVETSAYHEVVAARDTIFIGHRGTGKTANAAQAYQHVAANKTNLAILIKPPSFEFPAILNIISRLPDLQRDYFFDSLWQFIIQSEIAASVHARLSERKASVPFSTEEQSFLDFVENVPFDIKSEVSVRLEQILDALLNALPENNSEADRNFINEAFHTASLVDLRAQLGTVLKGKKRVAVFIDNLDKGWERGTDFHVMARFILGLLTARGRVVTNFEKQDYWRNSIKLTVAIFLRSDIYNYLRTEAREPDKLPISSVSWKDAATLIALVELRFLSSEANPESANELWGKYFATSIAGEKTQDYLLRVCLPRPRDIIYFCNAAISRAVDRLHESVHEEDFLAAEEVYSQYAYEALLVENGVTIPEMEDALLAFIEAAPIASRIDRKKDLSLIGLPLHRIDVVFDKLVSMSFFGLETSKGNFEYPEVGSETKKAHAKAARLEPMEDARRVKIHPAYHKFLGVQGLS